MIRGVIGGVGPLGPRNQPAAGDALDVEPDQVRPLANARYAALGIVDAHGVIERFITSGITAEERPRIGPPPTMSMDVSPPMASARMPKLLLGGESWKDVMAAGIGR